MSATVSFDGLASEPTSTDHFHDTSGLYSFELYRVSPALVGKTACLNADRQYRLLCLCGSVHPPLDIHHRLGVRPSPEPPDPAYGQPDLIQAHVLEHVRRDSL